MAMMLISSMSEYIKGLSMQHKWRERKDNPYMEKGKDSACAVYKKQVEDQLRQQKLSAIHGKMKAGLRLTGMDMEYLRRYAPELYKKAAQIEKEREEYRRELEKCKTKEEVQRLNMQKLQQLDGEAKAVMRSGLSRAEKAERLEFIGMRMAAIQNEHADFINTPQYSALPSEYDEEEEDSGNRISSCYKKKREIFPKINVDSSVKRLLGEVSAGEAEFLSRWIDVGVFEEATGGIYDASGRRSGGNRVEAGTSKGTIEA